ncbi:MAG: GNAT family N-acetyltransferase [Comamonadaceae bacterium]
MNAAAATVAAVEWKCCAFNALSLQELHDVLQLRSEVFVLEQSCVFQDIDGSDAAGAHLMGHRDGELVVYARCLPAGIKFVEASIGRVVTRLSARGHGLGHLLMDRALSAVCTLWGQQPIRIGAQAHLEKYYQRHGFVAAGKPYIEDGIEHLEMIWHPLPVEHPNDH